MDPSIEIEGILQKLMNALVWPVSLEGPAFAKVHPGQGLEGIDGQGSDIDAAISAARRTSFTMINRG